MDNSPSHTRNNNAEGLQPSLLGTSTPFSASSVDHEAAEEMEKHVNDVLNDLAMTREQLDASFMSNEAGYLSGNFGDLDLGRIFLAYKQLDARVSRLEAHAFPQQQQRTSSRNSMKRQFSNSWK